MVVLKGHFDGDRVVLDECVPENIPMNARVNVIFSLDDAEPVRPGACPPDETPPPGSLAAVRRAVGTWWMSPDQTRRFLKDVMEMRHREDAERALPPEY